MSFKLQHIDPESKFCQHLRLPFLETCYPRELVCELLTKCQAWEQRERKLSQLVIVYYVIALSLFRQFNVTEVFAHLSRGLRWLWPDPCITLPTGGALTARRLRLGIVVMRHLFRQCCRPLASPETRGAFAFGLRLMAVDSTLDEVPDTPANALHFGRLTSGKSQSPFPQVRCLYLAEVGTHAIVDAVLARCKACEQALAWVVLRSIQSGMLVMTDRNFISVNWLAAVRAEGRAGPLSAGCWLLQRAQSYPLRWQLPGHATPQRASSLDLARHRVSLAACGGSRSRSLARLTHLSAGRSLGSASAGHHPA